MKIHGGTNARDIQRRLEEAVELSRKNFESLRSSSSESQSNVLEQSKITAILFFDEANTTEEVGLIKEIMCDKTLNGKKIEFKYVH